MTTATRINQKFVASLTKENKDAVLQLEKGGAIYRLPMAQVNTFRNNFASASLSWLQADEALSDVLAFAVKFAIDNKLNRLQAGKACALLLGVPSMTACLPNDAQGSKKIKSKWEFITRSAVPTQAQLDNNPQMDYAEVSAQLALDDKTRKAEFVAGVANKADGTGEAKATTLEEKLATKDFASFAKIIADRVKGEDALALMAQLINHIELTAEASEAIARSLTPQKVAQGAKRAPRKKATPQPKLI